MLPTQTLATESAVRAQQRVSERVRGRGAERAVCGVTGSCRVDTCESLEWQWYRGDTDDVPVPVPTVVVDAPEC